jgi:membrane fusion protein, heavy metal efflux system
MKIISYTIIITALVVACNNKGGDVAGVQDVGSNNIVILSDTQYKALGVRLAPPTIKSIPLTTQVNGTLDVPPQNLVTISPPMGGFVKSTKLLQGMKVKEGEVIATLEHQDYIQLQQDYLDNISKLEYLEAEYDRQQQLAQENVNSQKALQQARSNFESARATADGLRAKLGMLNIDPGDIARHGIRSRIELYAPVSGFVTEVNVNLGEYVANTDVMFRIVNMEHLHAELQVYEKDIRLVRAGQKVSFTLAHETSPRTATVYLVGKEISKERTVRVHCHLDQEDESLLPGMYVTARIETNAEEGNVIPLNSIVSFEGEHAIFVKRGRRQFELILVKTGNSSNDSIIIRHAPGLHPGDSIVTDGAFELLGMLKNNAEADE